VVLSIWLRQWMVLDQGDALTAAIDQTERKCQQLSKGDSSTRVECYYTIYNFLDVVLTRRPTTTVVSFTAV
jgi:hypothetical protein